MVAEICLRVKRDGRSQARELVSGQTGREVVTSLVRSGRLNPDELFEQAEQRVAMAP